MEVTDLFEEHPVEQALVLLFGGDVLDVDANSDYGAACGTFHDDYGSAGLETAAQEMAAELVGW